MYSFQEGRYRKVLSGFQSFSEIMKEISNFILSVMSYMAGDFNISRAFKNTISELSYIPGSYKAVN